MNSMNDSTTQHSSEIFSTGLIAILNRLADGLIAGTVAAFVVALAHLVVLVPAGVSPVFSVVAVTGAAALTLGPLVALFRGVRGCPRGATCFLVGIGASLPALALFGSVLFAGTRHRPLGAVTFAIVAFGIAASFVALVDRLTDPERQLLRGRKPVLVNRALAVLWFGGATGALFWKTIQSTDSGLVFSAAGQLATLVILFGAASKLSWPSRTSQMVKAVGASLCLAIVVLGLVWLQSNDEQARVILRNAPVVTWPWAGWR